MKKLFLALAIWFVVSKSGAITRVALVSDSGDNDIAKVMDLATVRLGQEKEIELLSRDEIQRVLDEQKLTLDGALNPSHLVTANKLLKVDLFAVLDAASRTNQAGGGVIPVVAGLTVFDAKTGVRLEDAALVAGDVEKLAVSVAAGVLKAQRKQVTVGLPTICLLSVRNADLPRSLDQYCDSVGLLLERRLTAESQCAVLERQRLNQVNQERALPGDLGQQQLLASLITMEMECARGPEGKGLRATVRLANRNGQPLAVFAVTNAIGDANELAASLQREVCATLKITPDASQAEDRDKEAARFRREAEFFLSHGDCERGVSGLEASFALAPDTKGLRRELAGALVGLASSQTNLLTNLRIADRAMDLFLDCALEARKQAKPAGRRAAYNFTHDFSEWDSYMRRFDRFSFQSADYLSATEMQEARQRLLVLYEKYRSFQLDISLPALFQAVLVHTNDNELETRDLFHDYGYVMLAGTWSTESLSALFPDEWSRDWLVMLKDYMDLLEQAPLELHPRRISEVKFVLDSVLLGPSTWNEVNMPTREKAWDLMASHSCPLVRAFGKLNQLTGAESGARNKRGFSQLPVGEPYRLYLEGCLNDPSQSSAPAARRLFYEAAAGTQIFNFLGNTENVAFCDSMLKQNDLLPFILNGATTYLMSQTNQPEAVQAVDFCNRAISILTRTNGNYFSESDSKQYLQEVIRQRDLAQRMADGFREPEPSVLPPAWREVRQLVDLASAKSGLGWIFRPVVQDEVVYAAGFGTEGLDGGQFLQLLVIPLGGGAMRVGEKIAVTNVPWAGDWGWWDVGWERPDTRVVRRLAFPRAACADLENYYLGTKQGIFVFPKSGGKVRRISQENGLPADEVTALDCLDGKLYAGLGESGYFVSYDLKKQQCDVICSARRREQLSPFDNGSPLKIPIMMADEIKHRIVFLTGQAGGGENWSHDMQKAKEAGTDYFEIMRSQARAGMWSFTPATGNFKCLLPRHPNAPIWDVRAAERVGKTKIMLDCNLGQALFDLNTDQATLIYGHCFAIGLEDGMGGMVLSRGMIVNPALHVLPLMNHWSSAVPARFIHGDWIWTALGFSRISIQTGRQDPLPSLRPSLPRFEPSECFQVLNNDTALIGDQYGLWLVQLTGGNDSPQKMVTR